MLGVCKLQLFQDYKYHRLLEEGISAQRVKQFSKLTLFVFSIDQWATEARTCLRAATTLQQLLAALTLAVVAADMPVRTTHGEDHLAAAAGKLDAFLTSCLTMLLVRF